MSEPEDRCHPSHVTRSSDAATFDEICVNCDARDITGGGWGWLRYPCSKKEERQNDSFSCDHRTPEAMAAELRVLGWRVQEPLTQDNCKHTNTRGSISSGTGGYKTETYCLDCGEHWSYESPPLPNQGMFWIQNNTGDK